MEVRTPILEGIVTTRNADGSCHLAPMGPRVLGDFESLLFRPFPGSTTYSNLLRERQGVLHVTDNASLIAHSVIGGTLPVITQNAIQIQGYILSDACQAYEFQVHEVRTGGDRQEMPATILQVHNLRPFWGFNRAKHGLIELAILATRLHLIPDANVRADYEHWKTIIDKTASDADWAAFEMLTQFFTARGILS